MAKQGIILFLLILLVGCKQQPSPLSVNDDNGGEAGETLAPDLSDIEQSGELIAVTVNGPDTYYEYRNRSMGLQFMLAETFANHIGMRLRMEVAKDTAEMIAMLKAAKADLLACELPRNIISENGLLACGTNAAAGSWSVRKSSPDLAEELNTWYSDSMRARVIAAMGNVSSNRFKSQHSQPVFYSKNKGVVSNYDALFLRASRMTGWDWKLLASQCYQESGFDKNAVSWAGARGLMQVMPSTATKLGVNADDLFDPETNMMTAARLINILENKFAAIRNPQERKKFVLAAYNGGSGHITDAMALARKYGRNPYLWSDVSYYVLHLSDPHFYKDPIVKCGYMIGSETYNYVNAVMGRWGDYHSVLHNALTKGVSLSDLDGNTHKRNRFSKKQNIVGREDSLFKIKK